MTIIRNRHNSKKPFVILSKLVVWNEKLSLGALGLWSRCISRPDNWEFKISELAKCCKVGRDSIYTFINELKGENLCVYVQHRIYGKKDGKVFNSAGPSEYIFLEIPASKDEVIEIQNEMKASYKKSLEDLGYDTNFKEKEEEFKKSLQLPGFQDTRFQDPGIPTLTSNYSKQGTKERTNPEDVVSSSDQRKRIDIALKEEGISDTQINILMPNHNSDDVESALDFMKAQSVTVDNTFGWLSKCLKENWHENAQDKEKAKKETFSNNHEMAKKIEAKFSSQMKPGSSIQATQNHLLIIRGQDIVEIPYTDRDFNVRCANKFKEMGLII